MFVAPTRNEWIAIYAPLSIIMIVAILIELQTGRIPNALVFPTFIYFMCARLAIGPEPFKEYFSSVALMAFVAIGIGYHQGLLAPGAAKFAVAIAAALLPWMALTVAGASAAVIGILWVVAQVCGPIQGTMPGSVVISTLTAGAIALSMLGTKFSFFLSRQPISN